MKTPKEIRLDFAWMGLAESEVGWIYAVTKHLETFSKQLPQPL
jgi:hypothetical protein